MSIPPPGRIAGATYDLDRPAVNPIFCAPQPAFACYDCTMERNFDADEVCEGLRVGPAPVSPEEFELLHLLGVTDILSLQPEDEAANNGLQPTVAFRLAAAHGMVLHRIEIEDFARRELIRRLLDAVDLIERLRARGRQVYVHCALGLNRSPTVCAAFLAKEHNVTPEEAVDEVRKNHPSKPDLRAIHDAFRQRRFEP